MMEVMIRNADGNLEQTDRDYAAKKLSRLDRYFNKATRVEVVHRELKYSKSPTHLIEVTIFADGKTIRGEETHSTVHAAIDLVGEKLENRLRRIKKRIVDSYRHQKMEVPKGFDEPTEHHEEEDAPIRIRERKRFSLKPQTVEDAALEMEMLGHSFFVFKNQDTRKVEVLYKRNEGGYGLIEPEI